MAHHGHPHSISIVSRSISLDCCYVNHSKHGALLPSCRIAGVPPPLVHFIASSLRQPPMLSMRPPQIPPTLKHSFGGNEKPTKKEKNLQSNPTVRISIDFVSLISWQNISCLELCSSNTFDCQKMKIYVD